MHEKPPDAQKYYSRPGPAVPIRLSHTLEALNTSADDYSLASRRYDLSKLRAKGLVEKVPHSRRYRLTREGYSICLVFLKLFDGVYAPLITGLLQPVAGNSRLQQKKRSQLDRLFQQIADDIANLFNAVGPMLPPNVSMQQEENSRSALYHGLISERKARRMESTKLPSVARL